MPFSDVEGGRLYWKRDGRDEAPALVLLNSIGTDMDLWDLVLPQLSCNFALLRIDARGHGASSTSPGDLSMGRLAEDVLAVADAAGFGRFSLAGVSLGGMIGMELALAAPQRVERLVLICTSATMDPEAWQQRVALVRDQGMPAIAGLAMERFLSDKAQPAIRETVQRQLLAMDPEGYASCAAAIRGMDIASRLHMIGCPTLVVTGMRDASTPLAGHGDYIISRIPGAKHLSLDAGHLAPFEAPHALAAGIAAFLQD